MIRILMIEDNTGDADLIRFMLRQAHIQSFTIERVVRLSAGLEYLALHWVDLVLLDLNLPDSKGLDTFRVLYDHVPHLPIVLLTGFSDETLALEAMRLGAQDYLVKGQVDAETLPRAIRYAIERKRAQEALATRLRYEEALAACSQVLLAQSDVTSALQHTVDVLQRAARSAWVCIFENFEVSRAGLRMRLCYESHATHVKALINIPELQALPYQDGFEDWRAQLSSGEPVYRLLCDMPSQVCELLERSALRSMLAIPIFSAEVWYGFIVFGDTDETLAWGDEDVRLLRTAAGMIGSFVRARRDAETRVALLREVNHRVKNNLAAIVGFLYAEQTRAEVVDQPVYQSIMQELIARVQGLAAVHSMLSASEWSPVLLETLVVQVVNSALDMVPPGRRIVLQVTPSSVRVDADRAHHVALVINELTTNAIKHTLEQQTTTQIDVSIAQQENMVRLEFRDDGPGYPEAILHSGEYNVGFELIKGIVRQNLQGHFDYFNDHGAVAVIEFAMHWEEA